MLWWLIGCALHWGVPPATDWSVGEVQSLVTEPGLGLALEQELASALAAQRMIAPGAPPVDAVIVQAESVPTGRAGDQILYEVRLGVRFSASLPSPSAAGGRAQVWTQTRSRLLPDPGSAGLAQAARSAVFAELVREVAQDAVLRLSGMYPG